VVESGAEALGIMSSNSFDVVICDFLMPKMDGILLLKKLREKKDYTSFVFFSGNADDTHEVKMIGLGAYQLVQKNDFKLLLDAIKKALKHAEELQQIRQETTQEMDDFLSILHSTK
jgi:two-component system, NtrC family, response regulator HydG